MNHEGHQGHEELIDCDDDLIRQVLTAAIAVHRHFGPGLLESVYELALMVALKEAGIPARRQVPIPVSFHGEDLGVGFKADIIVAERLLLEFKAVQEMHPIYLAQTITYLKILRFKRGLLLNFNVPLLKQGIRRVSI
jgi:GxxExxY protein